LRRVGAAPRWVVDTAFVFWGAGLAALAGALWKLRAVCFKMVEG
jgi:hypothetical protein